MSVCRTFPQADRSFLCIAGNRRLLEVETSTMLKPDGKDTLLVSDRTKGMVGFTWRRSGAIHADILPVKNNTLVDCWNCSELDLSGTVARIIAGIVAVEEGGVEDGGEPSVRGSICWIVRGYNSISVWIYLIQLDEVFEDCVAC